MATSKEHLLKCVSEVFIIKWQGLKPWEFRINDRGFKLNDIIVEQEYDPQNKNITGNEIREKVVFILNGGQFGIPEGYCIMTTKELSRIGKLRTVKNENKAEA